MLALDNIAFQVLSLAVLWGYCRMIYVFRRQIGECLMGVATFAAMDGTDNRRVNSNFVTMALALGAMAVGLLAVKMGAANVGFRTGAAVILAVACAVLGVVSPLVLRLSGLVTMSEGFVAAVLHSRGRWLATGALFVIPLAAAWSGVNPVRDRWLLVAIGVVAITLVTAYALHTLVGFMRQKVSLLVWFLYFCTVEIFPIMAVVLGMSRI